MTTTPTQAPTHKRDSLGHEWGPMWADPFRTEQMCLRCCLPDRSPWARESCNRMAEIAAASVQ